MTQFSEERDPADGTRAGRAVNSLQWRRAIAASATLAVNAARKKPPGEVSGPTPVSSRRVNELRQ